MAPFVQGYPLLASETVAKGESLNIEMSVDGW